MSGRVLTSGEAALVLGTSSVSVSHFARSGLLKHFRKNGRLRFDIADVQALRHARARRPAVRRGRPTLIEAAIRKAAVQ